MSGNKELLPNKKSLKLLHEKQQQLSKIFIKGLKGLIYKPNKLMNESNY